jgi:Tol biopolymer transport system component/DNA-binding winged helix-turn-helix (wHTH) protein
MVETQSTPRVVRFGDFEAELRTGELRKNGEKLKFGGQPFHVLAILLEQPGEVVTREELQKRLWPDTFVDVERNLNTAINKIREVLGDSAESPRFVETLPRRGYRFIGELEAPLGTIAAEPDRGPRRVRIWFTICAVLAISVMAVVAIFAHHWNREHRPPELAFPVAVPFTALPGLASSPAFSPEGSRISFAWSPGPAPNGTDQFDLYVKVMGSETLLRLTEHPSTFLSPAWSPDGTRIAFNRHAGADSGIYIVPALGGPEQKLRSTRVLYKSPISWSPDGKTIAFVDATPEENRLRIYLLSIETMGVKRIPVDSTCFGEGFPVFSHSGDYLAYWCLQSAEQGALALVSILDGKAKIVSQAIEFPDGLTWSADDKKLIYSKGRRAGVSELGEVSISNGSVRRIALDGTQPAASPKGDQLAYATFSFESKIWRRDLLHPEAPAVAIIPSSRAQFDAQFSPDGKRITFASMRTGVQGVWVSNEDGRNLIEISAPHAKSGSPQWSPDGTKIAFDSSPGDAWEIYVADLAEGKPRKLVTNVSFAIRPSWSRDGKWIYFVSKQPVKGIYRCPATGGDATVVSQDPYAVDPKESLDGKAVYFWSIDGDQPVLKKVALPPKPGTETEVDSSLHLWNWQLSPSGIYLVPVEAPRSVRYFDFSTKVVRTLFEVDRDLGSGLSISPDGRWILYSQPADVTGDIMLTEHFN